MTKKVETINNAIVEKVQSILNNTDCIDNICILIEGDNSKLPTIRYNIKEVIVPPDISDNKEATDGKDSEV